MKKWILSFFVAGTASSRESSVRLLFLPISLKSQSLPFQNLWRMFYTLLKRARIRFTNSFSSFIPRNRTHFRLRNFCSGFWSHIKFFMTRSTKTQPIFQVSQIFTRFISPMHAMYCSPSPTALFASFRYSFPSLYPVVQSVIPNIITFPTDILFARILTLFETSLCTAFSKNHATQTAPRTIFRSLFAVLGYKKHYFTRHANLRNHLFILSANRCYRLI